MSDSSEEQGRATTRVDTEDLTDEDKLLWNAIPPATPVIMTKGDIDLLLSTSYQFTSANYNLASALYNAMPMLKALDPHQAALVMKFTNAALDSNKVAVKGTNRLFRRLMVKSNVRAR